MLPLLQGHLSAVRKHQSTAGDSCDCQVIAILPHRDNALGRIDGAGIAIQYI